MATLRSQAAFVARSCGLLVTFGCCALGQSPASVAREFEAASVKLHVASGAASERAGIEPDDALVRIENLPLRVLIGIAYKVNTFQITGPNWLDQDTFDIIAKPEPGYQRDQLPELLKKLLADRFQLAAHNETKPGPAYALVVSKTGPKLRETTGLRTYMTVRPGLIEGNQRSIAELKGGLSRVLNSPVEDRTGLTGAYDLKLEWNPHELATQVDPQAASEGPSIFSAIQDQMGLKLERVTIPLDFVVVDRIQRTPAAN